MPPIYIVRYKLLGVITIRPVILITVIIIIISNQLRIILPILTFMRLDL
jgi:hypothetical protein